MRVINRVQNTEKTVLVLAVDSLTLPLLKICCEEEHPNDLRKSELQSSHFHVLRRTPFSFRNFVDLCCGRRQQKVDFRRSSKPAGSSLLALRRLRRGHDSRPRTCGWAPARNHRALTRKPHSRTGHGNIYKTAGSKSPSPVLGIPRCPSPRVMRLARHLCIHSPLRRFVRLPRSSRAVFYSILPMVRQATLQ